MEPNPSDSTGLQFHKRDRGGFLGPDWRSKSGLPGHQHPGLPGAPRLDHPDPRRAGHRPRGRHRADDLHRPQTFFKTFTQTGCTRVQFFEYKQSTHELRRGHPHRLPLLRVRLPRPDDALARATASCGTASRPRPAPACPAWAAPSPSSRSSTSPPGTVFKTQKVAGHDPEGSPRGRRPPDLHGARRRRPDRRPAVVQGRHVRRLTVPIQRRLTVRPKGSGNDRS